MEFLTDIKFFFLKNYISNFRLRILYGLITKHGGEIVEDFQKLIELALDTKFKYCLIFSELLVIDDIPNILKNKYKCDEIPYNIGMMNLIEFQKGVEEQTIEKYFSLKRKFDERKLLVLNEKIKQIRIDTKDDELNETTILKNCDSEKTRSNFSLIEEDDDTFMDVDDNELRRIINKRNHINLKSWACAKKDNQLLKEGANKQIIEIFDEMKEIYEALNEKWKSYSYQKAISAVRRYNGVLRNKEDAKNIRGIGEKLSKKIEEITETGHLRKLEELQQNNRVRRLKLFSKIWGVGSSKAMQLVDKNIESIQQLRGIEENDPDFISFNRLQKVGLKYFEDLESRMSNEEAGRIEEFVQKQSNIEFDTEYIVVACGSYRRGKSTCGDVDILVCDDTQTLEVDEIFHRLKERLIKENFLIEHLIEQEKNDGQIKYLGICKLPGSESKHRRLDIIIVPKNELGCATLYFTGSAHLNRSMRHLAKKLNMSLTEHSLNIGVKRVNGEKVNRGTPLPVKNEQDIFRYLGLDYLEPNERNH
ncbi:hypothetical protein SNEBB_010786 [Seison nebaliae]|nr:hypothetical protein SNEBB_010786 [Seison nebaliae]